MLNVLGALRAGAGLVTALAPASHAGAFAAERPIASLFERFSLRALGVASLLALVSVAANYSFLTNSVSDDDLSLTGEDPVAVLLDES